MNDTGHTEKAPGHPVRNSCRSPRANAAEITLHEPHGEDN